VSDIDTEAMDSLKVLDPNRPIREGDIASLFDHGVASKTLANPQTVAVICEARATLLGLTRTSSRT
jgi:hypothetical protein